MSLKNVDRLSSLHETVLSHILSLMPLKSAVQTSILSKRWRYIWILVKNLDFDDISPFHDLNPLSKFVDRVLDLCKASQIKLFRLRFSEIYLKKLNVSKWINEAVRLNVSELDIPVTLFELPLDLFTCKTLTKLRLKLGGRDFDVLEFPSSVCLPCLKALDIVVFSHPTVNAFRLIRGSPILEILSLQVSWRMEEEEYTFNIPTLKHLKLFTPKCASATYKIILNLPNLEHLFVGGIFNSRFVIEKLPSMVSVIFSFSFVYAGNSLVELLKGISGAKSLSLVTRYTPPSHSPLPRFLNLKHLELKHCYCLNWLFISQLFESVCELEHLFIEEPHDVRWVEPQSVPTCMLKNLRTIEFAKCKGRKFDIQFLEYMLKNAMVLKTLSITCDSLFEEEETMLCEQISKFPRASGYCEIYFQGRHVLDVLV